MRVYIVHSADQQIDQIVEVIRALRAEPITWENLHPGDTLASVLEAVRAADAVVALISDDASPNVFIEIGAALGARIPVLAFSESSSVASDLVGVQIVNLLGAAATSEALQLHLELFLDSIRDLDDERSISSRASTPLAPIPHLAKNSLTQGHSFEMAVAEVFVRAGVARLEMTNPRARDLGFDFVASLESVERSLRVILVEATTVHRRNELEKRLVKLSAAALEVGGFGVLVYDDEHTRTEMRPVASNVTSIGLSQLISRLQRQPLDQLLLRERNRAVHSK